MNIVTTNNAQFSFRHRKLDKETYQNALKLIFPKQTYDIPGKQFSQPVMCVGEYDDLCRPSLLPCSNELTISIRLLTCN